MKTRLTLGMMIALAVTLNGEENKWTAGDGDWNSDANWSKGNLPGETDTAVIDSTGEVTFDIGDGNESTILNMNIGSVDGSSLVISSGTLNSQNSSNYGRGVYLGEEEGTSGKITVTGNGILNVKGADSGGTFAMSIGTSGDGELDISGKGRVQVDGFLTIGGRQPINNYPLPTSGKGIVNISGEGVLSGTKNVYVGAAGKAYINVSDSGRFEGKDIFIGSDSYSAESHGEVTLNDNAVMYADWSFNLGWGGYGKLTLNGQSKAIGRRAIEIGLEGTGILEMNDSSYVESINNLFMGRYAGSEGKLVMNDNSRLVLDVDGGDGYGFLVVGYQGKGEFTINGGSFANKNAIYVGYDAGSEGVVNLNGGTVETKGILGRNGTGAVNFNGGYVKAAADSYTDFISDTQVTIHGNGATIDTNGQDLSVNSTVLGNGLLLKVGTGDLSMSRQNTSTGGITVNAGGLIAAHADGLGTGIVTVNTGASLDSTVALANAGGIVINGGTFSNNGDEVGTFVLTDQFSLDSGIYNLTILSTLDFDVVMGNGLNTFTLGNGGILDLAGSTIDYFETYQIFDNFASGTVDSGLTINGYDTANWEAVVDDTGLLYFMQRSNIPEPAGASLCLFGLAVLCLRRKL